VIPVKQTPSDARGVSPLIIGIAGGSGSGKTTIADAVVRALPEVAVVQHDSYYRHRPDLSLEQRSLVNYDHPDSLETDLLVNHLGLLARGVAIDRPIYDFTEHLRSIETDRVKSSPVIIVEGILVLANPELRALLGLKVYVDADSDVRLARRLSRDIDQRGRTPQSVLEQYYASVRPMHVEFVEPSKRHADLVIAERDHPAAVETLLQAIRAQLVGERPFIYSPTS
jgi:uridine kinase